MLKVEVGQKGGEWDETLASLPAGHLLQSWEWGAFKARWGWQAERLLWRRDGRPVAAAQVLRRAIPYTPWSFLYASKGPALDYTDWALAGQVLAGLEEYTLHTQALFIKIDPEVPRYYGEPQPGQALTAVGQSTLDLLQLRGWRFSPEQIQFRNTVVVDLTPGLEDLLAGMKSKCRYNIRLAERKGVQVKAGGLNELPVFYDLYAETAARDGFLLRPAAYYHDVWRQFLQTGRAELLLAWVEGEVVAGLFLFLFGKTAWYLYGASGGRQRSLMPNHLLQWEAIRRAKAQGCTRYDLWGAPDRFDETDRMWGVYQFKRGFGGQTVQGLGAFDYPARRPFYWAFTRLLPLLRRGVGRG